MDEKDEELGAFDPNIPEEGPSAPPPGWLDDIHGYQGHIGADDNPLYPPPPAYNPQPEQDRNTLVPNVQVPTVSEDVAREALVKFAESKWKYSAKPARNLTFKDLKPVTVYRYRLETYTEARSSAWQFEPYSGQPVDGPQYGVSPPPWDIPMSLPQRFTDMVVKARVPHSSFIKNCHTCHGCGRTRCIACHGRGQKRCTFCHGHGRSRNKRCSSCSGRGRKRYCSHQVVSRMLHDQLLMEPLTRKPTKQLILERCRDHCDGKCISCHGHGYKTCKVCNGRQNLMHFIELTVTWKNNRDDFIPDRQPDFPDEKFQKVTGDPFFVDESVLVYPIQGFPDQEICDVSRKLIGEHMNRFSSTSRILQQRQTIEMVPLTHAHYSYNGKDFDFYVFGMENKVHTAKYPSACTIL